MSMTTDVTYRPAVQAAALCKVYGAGPAAVTALDGVTVDFDAGRLTAIMVRPDPARRH